MKAPSEKHLEDWFVKRHIEIEAEHQVLGIDPEMSLVARQLRLPSGIADLVVQTATTLIVVELKKGAIDAVALAQCLRYMRDLKGIMGYALAYIRDPRIEILTQADPQVRGILIGHSVESQNLLIAADCADVEMITYDYSPETQSYDITEVDSPTVDWETYLEYAQDGVGEAFRKLYTENLKTFHRRPKEMEMLLGIRRTIEAFRVTQQDKYPRPVYDEFGFGKDFLDRSEFENE